MGWALKSDIMGVKPRDGAPAIEVPSDTGENAAQAIGHAAECR